MSVDPEDGDTSDAGVIVEVDSLASGGDGVGRLPDGRVVFVAGGVPGDRVAIEIVDERKRFVRARIIRVLEPGPGRVEPRCPHFGTCGGCLWQRIAYDVQLEAKRKSVADALERIGRVSLSEELAVVASPSPYAYRGRARFVECEGGVGYRVRGGDGAHAVDVCPVLVPSAEEALAARGRKVRASDEGPSRRAREWVVTTGSDGTSILTPVGTRRKSRLESGAPTSVLVEVAGVSLRVSGESFVQGNLLLWGALVEAVVAACKGGDAGPGTRFVELHAGAGFFTLPLARAGFFGAAIESAPSAVADLRENLARAELTQSVEVVAGRAETRRDLARRFAGADFALVDPPRTGLEKSVRSALIDEGPPRLVYLSCDPGTLARDLADLTAADYTLAQAVAFDLFPQTPHVETLVTLERDRAQR
ncbi:MAG: TRAM domain-containing protein [bacterium]|nr:TRAM domain-containing protein [bacterium]